MPISDRLSQLMPAARPPQEDERLLQLYWNRAELKKELSRLQSERHSLLEQLKQQQGAVTALREQVDQLEAYLGDPDIGAHALVYFQLRGLWRTCAEKLKRFGEQLQRQQEERERRRQAAEFDQTRQRELAAMDARLLEARANADALDAQVKMKETKLAGLRGFWNYLRRRRLAAQIENERVNWDVAATLVTDLSDDRADLESKAPPEFPGLSLEGKRIVNTAVIACAQQLVATLSTGALAVLAKDATGKHVFDVKYGGRNDCDRLMVLIREALSVISAEQEDLVDLKERTDRLRINATYRNDADTVPLADSIGTVPVPATFVPMPQWEQRSEVNVLTEESWDVYRALLQ
jgi:hypothetical protein